MPNMNGILLNYVVDYILQIQISLVKNISQVTI